MSLELIYTSSPRGLNAHQSGFCTVAATGGLSRSVATKLESLSGYDFHYQLSDPRASENPPNFAHTIQSIGGKRASVLSRVAFSGADYSGRANKIAHHFFVTPEDRLEAGPAAMLCQMRQGLFAEHWKGDPKELPGRSLQQLPAPGHIAADYWREVAGDPGWAGPLAAATLNPKVPAYVVFRPGQDVLRLFAESLAVLPPSARWAVTFATYYTTMPAGCFYNWRGVLAGTAAAGEIRKFPDATVIDLTIPLGAAPESVYVAAARAGRPIASVAKVSPARPTAEPVRPVELELAETPSRRTRPAAQPPPQPATTFSNFPDPVPGPTQRVRPSQTDHRSRLVVIAWLLGGVAALLLLTTLVTLHMLLKSPGPAREEVVAAKEEPSAAEVVREMDRPTGSDRPTTQRTQGEIVGGGPGETAEEARQSIGKQGLPPSGTSPEEPSEESEVEAGPSLATASASADEPSGETKDDGSEVETSAREEQRPTGETAERDSSETNQSEAPLFADNFIDDRSKVSDYDRMPRKPKGGPNDGAGIIRYDLKGMTNLSLVTRPPEALRSKLEFEESGETDVWVLKTQPEGSLSSRETARLYLDEDESELRIELTGSGFEPGLLDWLVVELADHKGEKLYQFRRTLPVQGNYILKMGHDKGRLFNTGKERDDERRSVELPAALQAYPPSWQRSLSFEAPAWPDAPALLEELPLAKGDGATEFRLEVIKENRRLLAVFVSCEGLAELERLAWTACLRAAHDDFNNSRQKLEGLRAEIDKANKSRDESRDQLLISLAEELHQLHKRDYALYDFKLRSKPPVDFVAVYNMRNNQDHRPMFLKHMKAAPAWIVTVIENNDKRFGRLKRAVDENQAATMQDAMTRLEAIARSFEKQFKSLTIYDPWGIELITFDAKFTPSKRNEELVKKLGRFEGVCRTYLSERLPTFKDPTSYD